LAAVTHYKAPVMPPVARPKEVAEAPSALPALIFDSPLDTRWAQVDGELGRVVHVFHQEWFGIRAAAGFTPGHKLALPAQRVLSRADVQRAVKYCGDTLARAVVVHSYSANIHKFVVALRKVMGKAVRIAAVWHGSTAQFQVEGEMEAFGSLLDLRSRGTLDALACVKPDMHAISPLLFRGTLLNLPPRVTESEQRPEAAPPTGAAFIPTPNDWRKNFYTNLYACEGAARLREVYVTATFKELAAARLSKQVHSMQRPDRAEVFSLVRRSDVVLNASLSECQPMTAVEALALRVPCITGPLGLGALDGHPLQQLLQVRQVDSVLAVRDRIEQVLSLHERAPAELRQMMESYEQELCSRALSAYKEFVLS
ncbi:MAG TPA: glycosyltransferase, partial [Aggregicoccus sp.]|nr:glycosyltransferase [Aggregicoccus sp.]